MPKNTVFIARSIDGYIAGPNGELDWLHAVPNPDGEDMGYQQLMEKVDAVVMGRTTFETVLGFGGAWPYAKPVFVLSTTLNEVPEELKSRVFLLEGDPRSVLEAIHAQDYHRLYIDGGTTIQQFLREDLIDELIITTMPILLGGGFPLFGDLKQPLEFIHVASKVYLGQVVQDHYRRKRSEG